MLINTSRLVNYPILSLHVGGRVATVAEVIIDPDNLAILACRVDGPLVGREVGDILPMNSVREFSRLGIIIDSTDDLASSDDIIRIRDVLSLNFKLTGLKVETERGTKLGKVTDSTVNPNNWQIQQLIVQRPFFKAIIDPELTISRNQITEIDDYKVIVKDSTADAKEPIQSDFTPNFVNPFREPDLAPETITLETNT